MNNKKIIITITSAKILLITYNLHSQLTILGNPKDFLTYIKKDWPHFSVQPIIINSEYEL